ncbi:MAG: hypothetical protein LKF96_02210 [Treponema sp.]|jgi:phosphopantothenoylcysteine decarboxylase/phosphopantothenate--cysteine ligase|nr:hypothetical protein [Treponema sp.]
MSNVPEIKEKQIRVLLHVSGSIACYKSCELARLLIKKGFEVQVTASAGALRFLQPAVFEGLTHRPLLTDIFGGRPDFIPHLTLAQRWADVIIAYPASAHCINQLAAGNCDDLFGAVCLANNYRHPLLIAPAMNSEMFLHPSVRQSLEKLAQWGTIILPTESGQLACGTTGPGKLIAPECAAEFIDKAVSQSGVSLCTKNTMMKNFRILITGGGSREPIDGVRCITNISTGRTASFLVDRFISMGATVTYLKAQQSVLPASARIRDRAGFRSVTYRTAGDLSDLMQHELTEYRYDAVIHAAAVSDFRPVFVTVNGSVFPAGSAFGKIPSDSNLSVTYEPVPKIADKIKLWSQSGNPSGKTIVVCFKLTDGADRTNRVKASLKLFKRNAADYVVSNELSEISFNTHPFELFGRGTSENEKITSVCTGKTLSDLTNALVSVLQEE